MSGTVQAIGAVAAPVAAVLTYVAARRKLSGSIQTTEAATLWAEATRMRESLADQLHEVRGEFDRLRVEYERCEELIRDLRRENEQLHKRIDVLAQQLEQYRRRT